MKLSDNPTAEEAANFFSETPQHKIARQKGHIKTLEEVLGMTRKKVAQLEERVQELETELVAERRVIEHYTRKYEASLKELARR